MGKKINKELFFKHLINYSYLRLEIFEENNE